MLRGTYLEYDAYWRPDNSLDLPKLTRFIGKYEGPYVTGLFEQTNHTDLSLELGSYIMPVAIKLTSEMLQTEDVQKMCTYEENISTWWHFIYPHLQHTHLQYTYFQYPSLQYTYFQYPHLLSDFAVTDMVAGPHDITKLTPEELPQISGICKSQHNQYGMANIYIV